jgi:hypothetical protein
MLQHMLRVHRWLKYVFGDIPRSFYKMAEGQNVRIYAVAGIPFT